MVDRASRTCTFKLPQWVWMVEEMGKLFHEILSSLDHVIYRIRPSNLGMVMHNSTSQLPHPCTWYTSHSM